MWNLDIFEAIYVHSQEKRVQAIESRMYIQHDHNGRFYEAKVVS